MKKTIVWAMTIVCIVALILSACEKEEQMAIDFGDVENQNIDFGDVVSTRDLTQKTVVWTQYIDDFGGGAHPYHVASKVSGGASGWSIYLGTGSEVVYYRHYFSGAAALWSSPASSIDASAVQQIAISYDNSNVANNPIIYINGVSVAVTEVSAPVGTPISDSGLSLKIGGYAAGVYSPDGRIHNQRIYNRILTPDEVMQIYTARGADNIKNGLVFCPMLYGAKGLQVFDGATLTTDNLILDPCSGATGIPTGSPVAVGETYLRVK